MLKKQEHINKEIKNSNKNYLDMFLSDKIQLKVPVKTSCDIIWTNLYNRVQESGNKNEDKSRKINFSLKYQLSAAASIIILIGAFYLFNFNKQIICITQLGEMKEFILPDQSKVILNTDSKLTYKKSFWRNSRKVCLTGEAGFKIKKGSLFTVNTNKGNVRVLGTSFNVFARNNDFKVSCFTGKVQVQLNENSNSVILTQGLESQLKNNQLSHPERFNISRVGKWQKGEFYYSCEKIENVFREIERQFKVKIITKNIGNRYYTGYFNNKNLEDALEMVCLPMNLEYSFKDASTIIIKERK